MKNCKPKSKNFFLRRSAFSLRSSALCQRQRGFVVLYTVLIATIILAITIGISLIAYNEVILSSSAAEGGEAFFAADSGAECALYWDRQAPSAFVNGDDIICNSQTKTVSDYGTGSPFNFDLDLNLDENGDPQNCSRVTVEKEVVIGQDDQNNDIEGTRIVSLGYNVSCIKLDLADQPGGQLPPRTIQRAIRVTY